MKSDKVVLGKTYQESLHGRKGVAVSLAHYLTGCSRVSLEWLGADGEVKEAWVDVTTLKDVKLAKEWKDKGGPQKVPPRM